MKWIYTLSCLLYIVLDVQGNDIILEEGNEDYRIFSNAIEFYEDPSNKLTIQDFIQNPESYLFKRGETEEQFSYHTQSNYWIRFKIINKDMISNHWVLEILDSRFDEVIFYSPDFNRPSNYTESKTGLRFDFDKREYQHKNFVFNVPLQLNKEKPHYYYLKIHPGTIGSFLFKIRSNDNFDSYAFKEYLLLGMYYGIVFILAFYNLLLYFTTKEKVYIYYFFYAVAWAFDSSIQDGLGFQFVWSYTYPINILGGFLFKILMLIFYLIYSQSFLDVSQYLPSWKKSVYLLIGLLLVGSAFFPYTKNHFSFDLVVFVYTFVVAILVYRQGYKPARFLILGNGIILFGLVLKNINSVEWINFMIQDSRALVISVVYIRHITMIFDIVILSVALGDRIRYLKQTNEQAQRNIIDHLHQNEILSDQLTSNLEQKVAERTRVIEEKNEQLKVQAKEINELNVILGRDNLKLQKNVMEEKEARISLKPFDFTEFSLVYTNEEEAYRFLEEVKWGKGYVCKKCGHTKYGKGTTHFARRCLECRYDESVKVFTAFNNCKFDIRKALYLAVLINRYGDNVSITDVSKELDIRYATCRVFLQKLITAANKKEYTKLKDEDKINYLILNG